MIFNCETTIAARWEKGEEMNTVKILFKPFFKKCIKYSQSNNPSYKIRMYTEKMRSRFIKKHFPEFYKYYIRINSNYGAAKADIWRVLILYKYGGIYIDCKSKLNNLDIVFCLINS